MKYSVYVKSAMVHVYMRFVDLYLFLNLFFPHSASLGDLKPARQFKPWKTNAVPPPDSYAAEPEKKKGAPPGMDMAIKWSNVYEDNGEDAPQPITGNAKFLPSEEQPSDSGQSEHVRINTSLSQILSQQYTNILLCDLEHFRHIIERSVREPFANSNLSMT